MFAHEAIRSYNGVVVGYGALLPNGNIIREIAYTSDADSDVASPSFDVFWNNRVYNSDMILLQHY